jgi:hypothetical protein
MRIRNTGESLSRPFPRLQRTKRCRGTTSHSDVKRRTSECTPYPWRTASGIPPLLPAATSVSNAPTCWCCPSSRIYRHRDTPVITSTPPFAPFLDVPSISIFLLRGLSTGFAPVQFAQAQSPRRPPATRAPNARTATQFLRASVRKCLTRTSRSRLLPAAIPAAASPTVCSPSHSPPPSSQPTSQ